MKLTCSCGATLNQPDEFPSHESRRDFLEAHRDCKPPAPKSTPMLTLECCCGCVEQYPALTSATGSGPEPGEMVMLEPGEFVIDQHPAEHPVDAQRRLDFAHRHRNCRESWRAAVEGRDLTPGEGAG